ncbi:MAG TPA: c-type cytochrome [Roseiflexaceae bacterium]|nr:c-type cytochrome [Roseiflexaceae bacterium]
MTRNLTIATVFMLAATLLLGFIWVRENSVLSARSERFTGNLEARGARDFEQYCAGCHGLTGEGGVRNGAPQINNLPTTLQEAGRLDGATGIIAKYGTVRNFVESTITSGVRGTAMPRWSARLGGPLRDDQIKNIASYIQGWWAAPGTKSANISADAAAAAAAYKKAEQEKDLAANPNASPAERGQIVFFGQCASCHNLNDKDSGVPAPGLGGLFGPDGTAAFGKVLPNTKPVTVENWVEWVKKGGAAFANGRLAQPAAGHGPFNINGMPPFPTFTDEQLGYLLAFLSIHDRSGAQTLPPLGLDGQPLKTPQGAAPGQPTATPTK